MTEEKSTFHPVWEDKYAAGHRQRYPWDEVVSFVFRNAPCDRPWSECSLLEVGCGSGANLWFAAREGMNVTGIDGSAAAISAAKTWFEEEGLHGDFRVTTFPDLPFEPASFDFVIDRAALVHVPVATSRAMIATLYDLLKPGGRFYSCVYCTSHTSFEPELSDGDGFVAEPRRGQLTNVGGICFFDEARVASLYDDRWQIESRIHRRHETRTPDTGEVFSQWVTVARKQQET